MNPEKPSQPENKKENILLLQPETILPNELKRKDRRWSPYFFSDTHGYQLTFHDDKIGFKIEYINNLPDELSEDEKSKFSVITDFKNGKEVKKFVYEYGEVNLEEERQSPVGFENDYHIAKPRKFRPESIKPQEIQPSEVAELIKNKKVIFYTGAGISAPVGLSMQHFRDNVGSDMSKPVDKVIKSILNNPTTIERQLNNYTTKAFESPATPAHKSLTALAQYKGTQIMTENFDFLQEQAGVKPYRVSGPRLKSEINPEWLKEIDYVICVGLSCDDRGFLAWYKENNPNGKIVSFDIKQPSYLDDNDIFIKGDLQKILPKIEKQIKI